MLWRVRLQQASTWLLLALCALQSITPDTHDLASTSVISVILDTSAADFPIDDQSSDDVCGPAWARLAALEFQSHAAPRLNPGLLPTIAPCIAKAEFDRRSPWNRLGRHIDHLHQLCRLNC